MQIWMKRWLFFLLAVLLLLCPAVALGEEPLLPAPIELDSSTTLTLSAQELIGPDEEIITLSILVENTSPYILRDCTLYLGELPAGVTFVPDSLIISSIPYPGLTPNGSKLGNVPVYHSVGATFQLHVSSQAAAGSYDISAGLNGRYQARNRQIGEVTGRAKETLTIYRPLSLTDTGSQEEAPLGPPVLHSYTVTPESILGPKGGAFAFTGLKLQVVLPEGNALDSDGFLTLNDKITDIPIEAVGQKDPEGPAIDLEEFLLGGHLIPFTFSYEVKTSQIPFPHTPLPPKEAAVSQPVLYYRLAGEDFWRSASLNTATALRNRKTFSYQWSDSGHPHYFSVSSHVRDISLFQIEPIWAQGELYSQFSQYAASSGRKVEALCKTSIRDEEEPVTLSPYTVSFFNLKVKDGTPASILYLREDGSIGERPATVSDRTISSDFSSLTAFALAIPDENYGKLQEFEILASTGSGGAIQPSGISRLTQGSSAEFLIRPQKGYRVEKLLVDGQSLPPAESYLFEDIAQDHEIHVVFTRISSSRDESSPAAPAASSHNPLVLGGIAAAVAAAFLAWKFLRSWNDGSK